MEIASDSVNQAQGVYYRSRERFKTVIYFAGGRHDPCPEKSARHPPVFLKRHFFTNWPASIPRDFADK